MLDVSPAGVSRGPLPATWVSHARGAAFPQREGWRGREASEPFMFYARGSGLLFSCLQRPALTQGWGVGGRGPGGVASVAPAMDSSPGSLLPHLSRETPGRRLRQGRGLCLFRSPTCLSAQSSARCTPWTLSDGEKMGEVRAAGGGGHQGGLPRSLGAGTRAPSLDLMSLCVWLLDPWKPFLPQA